jgi:hypothetical protein
VAGRGPGSSRSGEPGPGRGHACYGPKPNVRPQTDITSSLPASRSGGGRSPLKRSVPSQFAQTPRHCLGDASVVPRSSRQTIGSARLRSTVVETSFDVRTYLPAHEWVILHCAESTTLPFASVGWWLWRSGVSDWPGWVFGRRRADSLSPCRLVGLTGFCSVARRRPRITGVT